jgi:DNA-binding NarL/FixJ family response regulator
MAADNHRTAPAVRVLVVEDFEPFRRLICSMLRKMLGFQIVGEVSDGLDAVCQSEELQPDIILLDISLPGLDGISAARQIRTLSPQSRIIFVTQEADPDIVQEAFNVGAAGYVVKTKAGKDLLAALDAVLGGGQLVSIRFTAQESTTQATMTSI